MMALHAADGGGRPVALSSLTPRVAWPPQREGTRQLIEDIQANGMRSPIKTYDMKPSAYRSFVKRKPHRQAWQRPDSIQPDGSVRVVEVGNQRYAAALHLGYTHIDARHFKTLQELKRCE